MPESATTSLKKLIEKVKRYIFSSKKFNIEEETIRPQLPSLQNPSFPISNDDVHNTTNEERFRIDEERQIGRPTVIHPTGRSNSESNSKLRIEAVTRPKRCRICRAENKITRLPSNQWKCKECGHTWN